ncbi:Clavaminate synthase-like protein [Metschnikowia bicuspidata var. bicuspidata NRRL YB-4993]|uniref:Clavaminate synthase-like protein n=1 Tax=Metschnikowia bicuspidata var. bicuspidata NRRL YB-4993 TaxID=869754 RepID=A0A1A0H816_9ASCO|nr:Clavaminate synthase-like protein [Metschnikowia bicuspidata var. bicuspidata NRRL YB-4993]OBA20166.1 Clavaminate synthase-like protein [Metschnikowia bicuspidata var. bicuspidata NRRL YB-4993]
MGLKNIFLRSKPTFLIQSCNVYQKRSLSLVSFDDRRITVSFPEDVGTGDKAEEDLEADHTPQTQVTFSTIFLRDACESPESVDVSTRQKSFTTAQVAKNLKVHGEPSIVRKNNQDHLIVQWKHDDGSTQKSSFSEQVLKKYKDFPSRMAGKFFMEDKIYWSEKELVKDMKLLNLDYHAFLEGGSTFSKALKALNKHGICFVNKMDDPLQNPKTQDLCEANLALWPVAKVAKNFGYIKPTFYGTLFDVKNDKNAKNIANTNKFLPLHMDLCYYESPPGLQLLHFIKNSTLGGENVFADSFLAVSKIRKEDSEAYEALKKVPITFHYKNNNEYYYYLRPLIVEDPHLVDNKSGQPLVKEVNYSPPFQGPFEVNITSTEDPKLFDDFIRGMIMFEDAINDRANQYIVKTPENSCVIFDNRRVLHSRLEFSDCNGGDRWLMGCYVDGDSFRSRLRTHMSP